MRIMTTTTRSKGSVPPTFSPSLAFSHGKKYRNQTFYTLSDARYHHKSIPEMRHMVSITCSYGWCLMVPYSDDTITSCHLFNPVSMEKIELPPSPEPVSYNNHLGVITSSPTDDPRNCVVMLINKDTHFLLFCQPLAPSCEWFHQDLEHTRYKIVQKIFSVTSLKGIVCILCSNCLANCLAIVRFGKTTIAPAITNIRTVFMPQCTLPNDLYPDLYIVESCGDIYMVRKCSLGKSEVIQTFDVFKLDLSDSRIVWVKVETLGDRIFLLSSNSVSLSSTQFGVQGDRIYFCNQKDTSFYTFHMGDGSITVSCCPDVVTKLAIPYWIVPDQLPCPIVDHGGEPCLVVPRGKSLEQQVRKVEEPKREEENWIGYWNDMPDDLIRFISSYLWKNVDDYTCFRLACKTLKSIIPVFRPQPPLSSTPFPMPFVFEPHQPPWLMSTTKHKYFKYKIHHPIYNYSYSMDFPDLDNAFIRHYKNGWLLMLDQNSSSLFFFNPVFRETIRLPDFPEPHYQNFVGISFSSSPPSEDCIIFGHQESNDFFLTMLVYRFGEDSWKVYTVSNEDKFVASYCHPVFYNGSFYCLGEDGKIGIFQVHAFYEENRLQQVWRVLPNLIVENMYVKSCFLLENDGQILSVFMGGLGHSVRVLKLDQSKLEPKWIKLQSLGDYMVVLSHTTSIMRPTRSKTVKNKIYLPIFHDKRIVFYSLQTGKYHTIGNNNSHKDWDNTCVEWQSTWIDSDAMLRI